MGRTEPLRGLIGGTFPFPFHHESPIREESRRNPRLVSGSSRTIGPEGREPPLPVPMRGGPAVERGLGRQPCQARRWPPARPVPHPGPAMPARTVPFAKDRAGKASPGGAAGRGCGPHSAARIRTTPVGSISTAPWLIMLLTKCAARSPCQVMSVVTSCATAWPTEVR